MTLLRNLTGTSPSGEDAANVEDVFSTYIYEGTNSAQTITNGIDLAGEGGMVWIKARDGTVNHAIVDTVRGNTKYLEADSTGAESTTSVGITAFNSDGYALGADNTWKFNVDNAYVSKYASWTFRKAPRFFDVVTYTGNGTAGRTIAHDLGVAPGMIIVKRLDVDGKSWQVFHRTTTGTKALWLNQNYVPTTDIAYWDNTNPTDSVFTVGDNSTVNNSGGSFVAYLFAHDPDGANDDGMIACGSYTGNGSTTGPVIDLGWEPQYVLIKNIDEGTEDWIVHDSMRSLMLTEGNTLRPNLSTAEYNSNSHHQIRATAIGFAPGDANHSVNANGINYIYMVIRAPMMVEPESGTDVLAVSTSVSTNPDWVSGFAPDMGIYRYTLGTNNFLTSVRLAQGRYLRTNDASAEYTDSNASSFDYSNGFGSNVGTSQPSDSIGLLFKRAKGFFDVVAYTGDGVLGRTVNHSLGVVPEMMWVKERSVIGDWTVFHKDLGGAGAGHLKKLVLNDSTAATSSDAWWANTYPTTSVFSVGDYITNTNNGTLIAYLFATLEGVSKVGSYTGNGSSQNIDCGFSGGARFVLIRRGDLIANWYIWDTTRGIIAGNDPHLSLNTTAAQVTTDDSIDPQSAGFTVNQVSATNINVSSATYIFYAIA